MTIPTTVSSGTALGNGVTQIFDYNFVPDSAANIVVIYTNTQGVETTLNPSQYTITIPPPATGQLWADSFTVAYPIIGSPIANGTSLTASRVIPLLQTTELSNQGNQWPAAIEEALDTLCLQDQQFAAITSRAIQIPIFDSSLINTILPSASVRANAYVGFDGGGNVITVKSIPTNNPIDLSNYFVTPNNATTSRTLAVTLGDIYYNVKNYGAKGDGITDDTAAIKAACAACYLDGGGTVYFPEGTYLITSTIDMYNYTLQTVQATFITRTNIMTNLKGAGRGASRLLWNGGQNSDGRYGTMIIARTQLFTPPSTYAQSEYQGSITDLDMLTNIPGGHQGGYVVATEPENQFTTVANASSGANIGSPTFYATYGQTADYNNTVNNLPSCAIVMNGLAPANISGCRITNFHYGVYFMGGFTCYMTGNDLEYNNVAVSLVGAVTTTTMAQNNISNNAVGVQIGTSSFCNIDDNVIESNAAGCAICVTGWTACHRIRKNYFENSPNGALIFTGAQGAGQFRNVHYDITENTALSIVCDLRYTTELNIYNNLIDTEITSFVWQNAFVVDPCNIYIGDNYYLSSADTPYGPTVSDYPVLFTTYNLPQQYIIENNTRSLSPYDTRVNPATTATGRTDKLLAYVNSATANTPVQIGIHNQNGAVAAKVTITRAGATPKNVTFAEYLVGITRQTGANAIAGVTQLNNNTVAGQSTGADSTITEAISTTVSGASGADNFVNIIAAASTNSSVLAEIIKVELYDATAVAWLVNTGSSSID